MTKMTRTKLEVVRTNAKHARPKRLTDDELAEMIEEATVDAYGPSEQVSGFYTMLEEHLDLPFPTRVLGVDVVVERIDLTPLGERLLHAVDFVTCPRGPGSVMSGVTLSAFVAPYDASRLERCSSKAARIRSPRAARRTRA